MYLQYFGFREQPFTLTPNPEFLFLSAQHQEAFAHLLYAIDAKTGFIELTGEVGTGKTTIIRTLLKQFDSKTHSTALIFNPTLTALGLLQEINREFGLPYTSNSTRKLHEQLNNFLLAENSKERTVVLVIDEAQNLRPGVLEQVRLISNLETEREKLIQIVLVGQPELKKLLEKQNLRQLKQRITVRYHLNPMEENDVHAYIRHRIKVAADGREPVVFLPNAVRKIYKYSGGLPRLINGLCDRLLLTAFTEESMDVTPKMAKSAIKDITKEEGKYSFLKKLFKKKSM
ncbi:MAG: AAA family ATPase [Desulfuromonadales bacterium]|nr:AAA family ATPase [Desulfuromonadales bacterium]